jgi:hypothetical protein
VAVAQLNIRRTLMIKTNPSKCKVLIIRSKNQQIPICKSLNPMKMSCATSTNAIASAGLRAHLNIWNLYIHLCWQIVEQQFIPALA